MEQNLCDFCQTIPFREGNYSGADDLALYRTQEIHGRIKLFRKLGRTEKWVPAPALSHQIALDVGYERTDTVPGLPSITANAAADCAFCKFLLTSNFKDACIEACKENPDVSTIFISLTYFWGLDSDSLDYGNPGLSDLELRAFLCRSGVPEVREYFYREQYRVMAEDGDPCVELLDITTKPPVISYEEKLLMMKQWVATCEGDCHPRPLSGAVPTRLLDVRRKDAVHLVDCKGTTNLSEWRYAALSHCWGPPDRPPLQTTKDSLGERSRHIPFETLPRNYQDAVTITRELGLEYLWIDSFCIIQDSIADWEQESTRMHEVYRNAYVTIVAARGSSCHDGFLGLEPDLHMRLRYKSSANPSKSGTYFLWKLNDVEREIVKSQWNRRGWTFQEQRFSDRTLFFTARDVAYGCSGSEILFLRSLQESYRRALPYTGGSSISHSCQRLQTTDLKDLFGVWAPNVNEYSGRILTHPNDRLPALSAMAKSLSSAAGGSHEYLAGLWSKDLHLWLLWRCRDVPRDYGLRDRLRHATGSEFIAPSWSWASQSQFVTYDIAGDLRFHADCAVRITETVVEVDGLNPYGRVKNASLRIEGEMRDIPKVPLECKRVNGHRVFFQRGVNGEFHTYLRLDWMEPALDFIGESQQDSDTTIAKLSMLRLVQDGTREVGLLLHFSGEDGVYFRVGTFEVHTVNEGDFFDNQERRTVQLI